ncbi:hypothetical protein AAEX28_09670 [Lentisphaerota bacterium WC36G]|nr:hypothetical protein LJT99_12505 [Lentisphaerae bacterium WC36]
MTHQNEFLKLILENKILCSIFVIGLFVLTTYYSAPVLLKSREVKNWTETKCYIKYSYMGTDYSLADALTTRKKKFHRESGFKEVPQIVYQYTIKGKQYTSSKYSLEPINNPNILYEYPKETWSKCYVNPTNPKEAFLKIHFSTFSYVWAILKIVATFIILIVYGAYIFITRNELTT